MGVLNGKAVVVTGAGQGLGRAYALHAAEAGAAVVVNDALEDGAQDVVSRIRESGGRATSWVGTVADPANAAALVQHCVTWFDAIDGLVNNAGVSYHVTPWQDDPARVRELIEVNVLGSMYCGIAAAKAMRRRGRGSIVNVTSGAMLGKSGAAAYSASKGAVASMTASWAVDLAEHGIRVNGVSPLAWTAMMRDDPRARQICHPEQSPERIAPLVTYLLSDLSQDVTGQLIRFTGDALHLIRQPAIKDPVLVQDGWDVTDIAKAFVNDLADELEPPPPQRWSLAGRA